MKYKAQELKEEFQKRYLEGWNYIDQFSEHPNHWRDGDTFGIRCKDGSVLLSDGFCGSINAYLELD